ncbi:MAG: DUF2911 domain-containing protein [Saprospiraceae bacterium]|nr:DUF2911 domain-containing protein [Saprospiraceae bacterium]
MTMMVVDLSAQIKTPAASPSAKVMQTVGLTDVTVEYSRPGKKGRDIFGGLVPYDEVWRLGANAATKITFSEDVVLGGKDVEAGAYAILAKPGKSNWTFMLYPYNSGNFGSYLQGGVEPITVMGEAGTMSGSETMIENFMISIDGMTSDGASIWFGWDNTFAALDLKVHTAKTVEKNIEQVMAGPHAGDYYNAASYYAAEGKNLEQALEWITKSVDMGNEKFWVLRQKSLIEAKLGKKADAIASAKKSLELAKKANNMDYIRMNEASIKEWSM